MDATRTLGVLATVCAVSVSVSASAAPGFQGPTRTPVDAIPAIVDLFASHSVVALDEHHGYEQGHAFRVALVRDRRFATVVDDIVLEFGNARYQPLIDRFISGGDVPYDQLQQVWQNTVSANAVWDRPIYEEFFRAVRLVNAVRPPEHQLRVLLGDPPIDWDTIRSRDHHAVWGTRRNPHAASVIRSETLAKGRRALVIYGTQHLRRMDPAQESLVELLDRSATRVFTIMTNPAAAPEIIEPDLALWRVPSLAVTGGTVLEKQMDAVLYLGPSDERTLSRLTPELCGNRRYLEMRMRRMTIVGDRRGIDLLKQECRI